MKVNGVEAKKPGEFPPLVFKRGDDDLVFKLQPVHDMDEFNALCPEPDYKKYGKLTREGWVADEDAPEYKDLCRIRSEKRWAYLIIKTLGPSIIEWDKVKLNDSSTWLRVEDELRDVLTVYEMVHLRNAIEDANTISQSVLESNRESFFRKQAALQTAKAGQKDEAENT